MSALSEADKAKETIWCQRNIGKIDRDIRWGRTTSAERSELLKKRTWYETRLAELGGSPDPSPDAAPENLPLPADTPIEGGEHPTESPKDEPAE